MKRDTERLLKHCSTGYRSGQQDYVLVEPWNRLFIWPGDMR